MDTAMRDLERIREQGPDEGRARQWGVWILAALTTVALVVALGMMVGGSSSPEEPATDPLAALEGLEGNQAAAEEEPEVDARSLTFPSTLVTPEERPEVAAAVAAASAELAHPEPVGALAHPPRREEPTPAPTVPRTMPAGSAAAPSAPVLTRTVREDPLMAASTGDDAKASARAPAGMDGKYTLQVISYRSSEEAEVFAETLRNRGHEAFVVSARIPERGTYWRVRIGPFDSLREAEAYRSDFEEDEGMNTYVVKKND